MGIEYKDKPMTTLLLPNNKNVLSIWYADKLIWLADKIIPRFYFYYGNGSKNHVKRGYGSPSVFGTVDGDVSDPKLKPAISSITVSGTSWGHGSEGNCTGSPFGMFTGSNYLINTGGSDSEATWFDASKCDIDKEYTVSFWSYTDEGYTKFGNIYLKIDNEYFTIDDAINAKLIKPIVPLAIYSELAGATFDLNALFTGGSTGSSLGDEDWCYKLDFCFQTVKKHKFEGIRMGNFYKEGWGFRVFDSTYRRIVEAGSTFNKGILKSFYDETYW